MAWDHFGVFSDGVEMMAVVVVASSGTPCAPSLARRRSVRHRVVVRSCPLYVPSSQLTRTVMPTFTSLATDNLRIRSSEMTIFRR